VAFSPDGSTLATGGDDKLVKLWDWKKRKLLRELKGHSATITPRSLSFHPSGTTLLSGDLAGTVRLWDVASGDERKQIQAAPSWGNGVFSPDGKALALWGPNANGTVFVYDGAGKRLQGKQSRSSSSGVQMGAFSPDGKTLALGAWDARVRFWDLDTGVLRPQPVGGTSDLTCLAVSPDGRWAASASADAAVLVWDLQTGKLCSELKQHDDMVWQVAFSPNGQYLASAGFDKRICLWDVPAGKLRHELQGHTDKVRCLAFSPDSKTLASGSVDRTAILWNVSSGTVLRSLRDLKQMVSSIAFSPDGKQVVTASQYETGVRFWDAATGREQPGLEGEALGGEAITFHPGGLLIVGGNNSDPGALQVWDYLTRKKLRRVEHHWSLVTAVHCAPDGTVASSAWDGTVCLWNPHTGALRRPPIRLGPHRGFVPNAVFTSEGRHLVVANSNGTIYVLRLAEAGR
jgi:WD40 repeat protein